MYEIIPAEKGFTLIYRGVEIGTAKLHCDAVLIAKQLDKLFKDEYDRGYGVQARWSDSCGLNEGN